MKYKEDFEELEPYYDAFWNCEVLDKIAISVTAPIRQDYIPKFNWGEPKFVSEKSSDEIIDAFEDFCKNIFYGGIATPCFWPNFGPDVFSAFLGVPLNFSDDSSGTSWADWSNKLLISYDDISDVQIKGINTLYRKCMEITKHAINKGKNKFIVGITDIHDNFDALSVLRGGPEKASIDLIENPDGVKLALRKILKEWEKNYEDYWNIVKNHQKGSDSWIGIWAPGKMLPVQSDLSCLFSSKMYEEFLLETILYEVSYLDYSIYHLDGIEALQHLDILLDIKKLNAIQWVSGARFSSESIEKWIPLYKKIQSRKKSIIVYPTIKEIPIILENLSPKGLLIQINVSSIEEAKYIMKKVGW